MWRNISNLIFDFEQIRLNKIQDVLVYFVKKIGPSTFVIFVVSCHRSFTTKNVNNLNTRNVNVNFAYFNTTTNFISRLFLVHYFSELKLANTINGTIRGHNCLS